MSKNIKEWSTEHPTTPGWYWCMITNGRIVPIKIYVPKKSALWSVICLDPHCRRQKYKLPNKTVLAYGPPITEPTVPLKELLTEIAIKQSGFKIPEN